MPPSYQIFNSVGNRTSNFPTAKMVGVATLIILIGIVIWQAPAISSFIQGVTDNQQSEYSTLSLVAGQQVKYQNNEETFTFTYRKLVADQTGLIYISNEKQQTRNHPAILGTEYEDFGLTYKITTVNSELAVIQVRPSP